jgi:hypothetical protein
MALKLRCPSIDRLHHSDQGCTRENNSPVSRDNFVLEAYSNNSGPGTLTDSYAKNAIVWPNHTFTITGNNTYSAIGVAAFSGGNIASPFDTQNGHCYTWSGE